jgi:hypothetical protein
MDTSARPNQPLVAGEPVSVLARALAQFTMAPTGDGMVSFDARLEPELGAPLQRALMRVEAELLFEDAGLVTPGHGAVRTPSNRRADAMVALVLRVSDALAS